LTVGSPSNRGPPPPWRTIAIGGTFDVIHKGHRTLLGKAFESARKVLIGVPSDGFVKTLGKSPRRSYAERVDALRRFLAETFPRREYVIQPLNDFFGPLFFTGEVQALVVSDETAGRVDLANRLRAERGLDPVDVIVVPRVLADDGKPISTTRIRRGEIDVEGHLIPSEPGT